MGCAQGRLRAAHPSVRRDNSFTSADGCQDLLRLGRFRTSRPMIFFDVEIPAPAPDDVVTGGGRRERCTPEGLS